MLGLPGLSADVKRKALGSVCEGLDLLLEVFQGADQKLSRLITAADITKIALLIGVALTMSFGDPFGFAVFVAVPAAIQLARPNSRGGT